MDLKSYVPVLLLLGITIISGVATISVSILFGPKRHQKMKEATYECGLLPGDAARRQVSVKYYLLAVLFILFDIETIYLVPWAVLYRDVLANAANAVFIFLSMLIFVGILFLGLLYVLRQGILNWNK